MQRFRLVLLPFIQINLLVHFLSFSVNAQDRDFHRRQQVWVDSVLQNMTTEQKLGQLFMVSAYPQLGNQNIQELEQLIGEYHIGGVIFYEGEPVQTARLVNHYQSLSGLPLLMGMDAEQGVGSRMTETITLPKQMTLGAVNSNLYLYNMGLEVAKQCKRMGININFAPVVDINSDPSNSLIADRSFGEIREIVTAKGSAYMRGMQDQGILACAKHFPGQGEVQTYSHEALPVVKKDFKELEAQELYPFKNLILDSVKCVMMGHMNLPKLDNTPMLPASLSNQVIDGVLRDSLGFDGLVISDVMNANALTQHYTSGDAEAKAILAGNDMVLHPTNVPKAIKLLKEAIADGRFQITDLDSKVAHILKAKYFAGLSSFTSVNTDFLKKDLNSIQVKALKQELFEQSITVLKNKEELLPVRDVAAQTFASVTIGSPYKTNDFAEMLDNYATFEHHTVNAKEESTATMNRILEKVKDKGVVVVGVFSKTNEEQKRYGVSYATQQFIRQLQKHTKVITVLYGIPYGLKYLEGCDHLICAYETDPIVQKVVPQAIFGAIDTYGMLPVTASKKFPAGSGLNIKSIQRIGYALPEMVGMDSDILTKIDSIIQEGISEEAMPGCQVVAIKDGKIVLEKSYGYFTYSKREKVNNNTIYDLASITKVASTVQSLMYLTSQGEFSLDDKLGDYLVDLDSTDKKDLKIKHILTHCSGLRGGYFFWGHVMDKNTFVYHPEYLHASKGKGYSVEVSPSVFAADSMKDAMWDWLKDAGLSKRRKYRGGRYSYHYSDLGYYFMQRIVEAKSGQSLDQFTQDHFYKPLGLKTMGYLPKKHFRNADIVPTEMDVRYRKELIRGYVHDPSAALMGGVAGHAGLFSNAHDLAVLMQMNLQGGYYGGRKYFDEDVLNSFNTRPFTQYKNRRAYGWDKPNPWEKEDGPTSALASSRTFGHTGFTGTCTWVDPEYNLVYVFLSNRVYPYAKNRQLMKMNIRENIQTVLYESIGLKPQQ
ncbi:glycoside hydrolase family 3 N-terminal domain-containing protein [Limibacter armeniacum]|uniref:glycoside hydrolase family 3 N-terminal domain-containing protein n=1 Tax=Limibacter armeniacum TaxID=466084 RepID=UPI002FE60432